MTDSPDKTRNESTPLLQNLDQFLAKYIRGLLPRERRYLILVPIIGLLSGLMAVGLQKILGLTQELCWGRPEETGTVSILQSAQQMAMTRPWLLVLIPSVGGFIVAVGMLFLRKREEFPGTPGLIESLAFKKGRLSFGQTLTEGLVSITAVGTGASLGREGAMVHSGAALGSWLGAKFRLEDYHVRVLLACGAAGGMAAAYNIPIGASVFAMEILLGSFALELFGPILICAVLSTLVSNVIFPSGPVYQVPHYEVMSHWEVLLDIPLGILLGFVSVAFIRVFSGLQGLFRWLEPIKRARPLIAMCILGLIGISFPQLFGNGYDTVNLVLNGQGKFDIKLLLALPLLKILVTALCRSGGVPGGLFTPSLFVGALLGNAFGLGVNELFPDSNILDSEAFALVGMGAIIAGTLQAPITAILMIFEMTQDYGIILPLMSGCIASALISHLFQRGSLYTEPLRRRGIRLPTAIAPAWIRQPLVRSVLNTDVATVGPAERFKQVTENFLRAPEGQDELYVTNAEGVCLGVISLHDIKRFIQETDFLDSVIAADIVNPSFPFVFADDPVSRAIELLSESDTERLAVLDGPTTRKLLGTVSKRKLLAAYTEANLASQSRRDRLRE